MVFAMPLLWEELPRDARDERTERVVENDAIAIADREGKVHFFRRGLIDLPIENEAGQFQWNVWVEVSQEVFLAALKRWDDSKRVNRPPDDGTIACRIPGYPDTIALHVAVKEQAPRTRPKITVLDDHPLRQEQAAGITRHRHAELIALATVST